MTMGKKGVDLALIFGGHKPDDSREKTGASDYGDDGDGNDSEGSDDNDMPSDFEAAYEQYNKEPTSQNMWELIKCSQGSRNYPNRG